MSHPPIPPDPFLSLAYWCAGQVSHWDEQDGELLDALAGLPPEYAPSATEMAADRARIDRGRAERVRAKAAELGIIPPSPPS